MTQESIIQNDAEKKIPPLFRAAKASSAIWTSTVFALIAGFLLQLTIAYKFGQSGSTDAYFMAQGVSDLIAKILLGGSITSVFLPVFVEYLTKNEEERAWKLANNLFHVSAVIFALILVVMEIFTDKIVWFIAPGFSPAVHVTTVTILRIMLPAFFFTMLTDLAIAVLNSLRVFGLPAASRLITPLLSFILVLFLADKYGIVILGLGMLLGGSLQLALVILVLARSGFKYRPMLSFTDQDLIRVLTLVAPFILSILFSQAAGVAYRMVASHFPEGSLSALKFGDKISQLTNALFLTNIVTVAFPAFSRAVANASETEIINKLKQGFRIMVYFGIPITLGIVLLRQPFIAVLYQRGSFTHEDTLATSTVLGIIIVSMLANGISNLLGHLALAMKVTKVSVQVTILTQIVTTILFIILGPRYGIKGLAMGSAISPFVLTFLYTAFLSKKLPHVWKIFMDKFLIKVAISGLALYATVIFMRQLPYPWHGNLHNLILIFTCTITGLAVYIVASFALAIPEVHTIKDILYYSIKKKP